MLKSEELILKNPTNKFVKPHHEFNNSTSTLCFKPIVKKNKTAFTTKQNFNNTAKLSHKERSKFFKKEFNQLQTEVVLNWCKLFTIGIVFAIASYFVLAIEFRISFLTKVMYAVPIGIIAPIAVYFIKSFKLFITRFDKENIYSAISEKLLAQKNQATQ